MTSAATPLTLERRVFQFDVARRLDRWLHVMPHPAPVVEVASHHVAAARWGAARGSLDSVAVEVLPAGAIMPSAVETNLTQPDAVRSALRAVLARVPDRGAPVALLIPDSVVRIFILPFDNLTRRSREALPLLRWRLKKSVPFDVEETVISWMRQAGKDGGLEVVTAVARQRIVREYEEALEAAGAHSCVVLSSALATLPLLEEGGTTLLLRLSGKTLTTVIVRGQGMCVYRVTEMPAEAESLDLQIVLGEVFPVIAYYNDTWGAEIDRAWIAGFGEKEPAICDDLARELKISVGPLSDAEGARELGSGAQEMVRHGLSALAGWTMNRGS